MERMLTTIDNPFNPFEDFDSWKAFDEQQGYYTCELLARVTFSSGELSEADQENAIDRGVLAVLANDSSSLYTVVTREL